MEEKKKAGMGIVAPIFMILILFFGVKIMFGMIEGIMPSQWAAQVWDDMYDEKGNASVYSLRMIPEEELVYADLKQWIKLASEDVQDNQVFWLYRQDLEEYVLYLPQQDRSLKNRDLSADEEMMPDGRVTLVIRARTSEESEAVVPEEQLFCIKSGSREWDGQRVRVVLDGRAQDVVKMSAMGSNIYDEDGMKLS